MGGRGGAKVALNHECHLLRTPGYMQVSWLSRSRGMLAISDVAARLEIFTMRFQWVDARALIQDWDSEDPMQGGASLAW